MREHYWQYRIIQDNLEFYALAPYSTYKPEFEDYSQDAKAASKWGGGHVDFWTKYLIATIYFSGLYKRIDYVTCYPSHSEGSGNPIMDEPMLLFTKCFRKTYLRDMILRHTQSVKSSYARTSGIAIDHLNQLQTINLRRDPLRGSGAKRFAASPLKAGKTILVVDDIFTRGYSLEAARQFVSQTNANIICLSWLKTINSDYEIINDSYSFNPYTPTEFEAPDVTSYPYKDGVVDPLAPKEVKDKLTAYDSWVWPDDVESS
ncbi:phosphoribosyltransferase [Chloroflexota bacterium]